jgi:ABC-2 type transport system permease protein
LKEFQAAQETQVAAAREATRQLETDLTTMIEKQKRNEEVDVNALNLKRQIYEQTVREQQQKIQNKIEELQNGLREQERSIELKAELEIQQIQRKFKLAAVLIPPIPPLLLGLIVFTRRRLLERAGISKARRLK